MLPTKDGLLVRNFGDLPRIQTLQELLGVGRDSSPAADVHAGLFVLGYGWSSRARSGSWRTRADLEVCPTNCAAFLILGKLPTKDGLLVRNFGDLPRIQT